jgi:hypothetical protein
MLSKSKQRIGYFEELPESTQTIVRELILEAAADRSGPEGFKQDDECMEDVECHSRDGFIAFDHNRGGLCYRNFATLSDYNSGGYTPAHKRAAAEIAGQIEYSYKLLAESTYERFKALLDSKGLTAKDCLYHVLDELCRTDESLKPVRRYVEDGESEVLSSDNDTVMHELRVMYHGVEGGIHSASVSAALNTEAPYHRSSISWLPGAFCEGAKEVEIEWTTDAELTAALKSALSTVSKEIF